MHAHTLRKPVRAVASLQETEWESAEVVQMQRHLSSLTEVSVDVANTLPLLHYQSREETDTAFKQPFHTAVCEAFRVRFHTPQDN